jgi:hypothetical protein
MGLRAPSQPAPRRARWLRNRSHPFRLGGDLSPQFPFSLPVSSHPTPNRRLLIIRSAVFFGRASSSRLGRPTQSTSKHEVIPIDALKHLERHQSSWKTARRELPGLTLLAGLISVSDWLGLGAIRLAEGFCNRRFQDSATPFRSNRLSASRQRTGCSAAAHTQQRRGTWRPTRFASRAQPAGRSAP